MGGDDATSSLKAPDVKPHLGGRQTGVVRIGDGQPNPVVAQDAHVRPAQVILDAGDALQERDGIREVAKLDLAHQRVALSAPPPGR